MTDDLVAFLKARLAEDEQMAQACIDDVGPEREGEPYIDGSGLAERDSFPSYPWGSEAAELAFMAGPGHPARVLAEVQAKHRILDEYEQFLSGRFYSTEREATLRWVVQLHAHAYASHPDWREEWASG